MVWFLSARGIETGCNGILGGKWYDPPGSKHMFDKLGDPRIYIFPDQGHIISVVFCIVGLYVLLCKAQSACIAC